MYDDDANVTFAASNMTDLETHQINWKALISGSELTS